MQTYLHNQLAYSIASYGDIEENFRIWSFFTHASRIDANTLQNNK